MKNKKRTPVKRTPVKKSQYSLPALPQQVYVQGADGTTVSIGYSTFEALNKFNNWVYRAVKLKAKLLANCKKRILVRNKNGVTSKYLTKAIDRKRQYLIKGMEYSDDFVELTDINNPLSKLIMKPCPAMSASEFEYIKWVNKSLFGQYFNRIVPTRLGFELWPLQANLVRIGPDRPVTEFDYRLGQGKEETYTIDEIVWEKEINPADIFGPGKSDLEAAWAAATLDEKKKNMDLAYALNMGLVGMVYSFPEGTNEATVKRTKVELHNQYAGIRNAGKTIVTAGATVTPVPFPDVKFGSDDKVINEIAAAFGLPDAAILMKDSNLSTSIMGNRAFMEQTIIPELRQDEEMYNNKILSLFGEEWAINVVIAYDNPITEDEEEHFESLRKDVSSGILTPNEARTDKGYEPIAGGDKLTPSRVSAQVLPSNTPPTGTETPPLEDIEPVEAPEGDNGPQDAPQDDTGQKAIAQGQQADEMAYKALLSVSAHSLYRVVKAYFNKQAEEVVNEALAVMAGPQDTPQDTTEGKAIAGLIAKEINLDRFNSKLSDSIRPLLETVADKKAQATRKRLGGSTTQEVRQAVITKADEFSTKCSKSVNKSTAQKVNDCLTQIKKEIDSGQLKGRMENVVRDRVKEIFGEDADYRAKAIAITESHRAIMMGQKEAGRCTGKIKGYEWQARADCCPVCEDMAGTKAGINDNFGEDDYGDIEHPPLHTNCRCYLKEIMK